MPSSCVFHWVKGNDDMAEDGRHIAIMDAESFCVCLHFRIYSPGLGQVPLCPALGSFWKCSEWPWRTSSGSVAIPWRPPGCKWTETHGWLDFWLVVLPVLPVLHSLAVLFLALQIGSWWGQDRTMVKLFGACKTFCKLRRVWQACDGKERIITEAAAESSAADEIEVSFGACGTRGSARFWIFFGRKFVNSNFSWPFIKFFPLPQEFEQVQGEGLPSDGVTHQDGCNSLEQSSGAAEQCDEIVRSQLPLKSRTHWT